MLTPAHRQSLQSQGAPFGSDNYYSTLFLNDKDKYRNQCFLAFFDATYKIPFISNEESIAQQKLQWWHEEIERGSTGNAQHPLCQAMQHLELFNPITTQSLHQCIEATQHRIHYCRFSRFDDVIADSLQSFALCEKLIHINSHNNEPIHHLSLTLSLADKIIHLRQHIQKSFVFFAEQDLEKQGIKHHDFFKLQTSPGIQRLLCDYHQRAQQSFLLADKAMTKQDKKALQSTWLRAKLALFHLQLIAKDNYKVFEYNTQASPLWKCIKSWWWHKKT
jgi:phytoene/squalene synthetase